jgi:hypothetical protein
MGQIGKYHIVDWATVYKLLEFRYGDPIYATHEHCPDAQVNLEAEWRDPDVWNLGARTQVPFTISAEWRGYISQGHAHSRSKNNVTTTTPSTRRQMQPKVPTTTNNTSILIHGVHCNRGLRYSLLHFFDSSDDHVVSIHWCAFVLTRITPSAHP